MHPTASTQAEQRYRYLSLLSRDRTQRMAWSYVREASAWVLGWLGPGNRLSRTVLMAPSLWKFKKYRP